VKKMNPRVIPATGRAGHRSGSPATTAYACWGQSLAAAKASTTSRSNRTVRRRLQYISSAWGAARAATWSNKGPFFIEVTTEYGPFLQWDTTHLQRPYSPAHAKEEIDSRDRYIASRPESRKLLDRTLYCSGSEFSRECLVTAIPIKGPRPGRAAAVMRI